MLDAPMASVNIRATVSPVVESRMIRASSIASWGSSSRGPMSAKVCAATGQFARASAANASNARGVALSVRWAPPFPRMSLENLPGRRNTYRNAAAVAIVQVRPGCLTPSLVLRCSSGLALPSVALPPAHFVHAHRLFEPLRHELAAVGEQEPLARSRDPRTVSATRISPPSAFAAMREARMTVAPKRSPSSSIGSPALRPTRTDSGSPSWLGEGALEGDGAFDGFGDAAERRHEPVAHRLHFGAAVRLQHLARDALVLAEHVRPFSSPKRDIISVWPTMSVKSTVRKAPCVSRASTPG